jgi:hypothetical protein
VDAIGVRGRGAGRSTLHRYAAWNVNFAPVAPRSASRSQARLKERRSAVPVEEARQKDARLKERRSAVPVEKARQKDARLKERR